MSLRATGLPVEILVASADTDFAAVAMSCLESHGIRASCVQSLAAVRGQLLARRLWLLVDSRIPERLTGSWLLTYTTDPYDTPALLWGRQQCALEWRGFHLRIHEPPTDDLFSLISVVREAQQLLEGLRARQQGVGGERPALRSSQGPPPRRNSAG